MTASNTARIGPRRTVGLRFMTKARRCIRYAVSILFCYFDRSRILIGRLDSSTALSKIRSWNTLISRLGPQRSSESLTRRTLPPSRVSLATTQVMSFTISEHGSGENFRWYMCTTLHWLQELTMISNNDSPFAIFINELDKFDTQPFHNIEPQITWTLF